MKLKDISRGKTRTRSIRATDETFHQLKVVGAIREQNQEQVLRSLLEETLKGLINTNQSINTGQ